MKCPWSCVRRPPLSPRFLRMFGGLWRTLAAIAAAAALAMLAVGVTLWLRGPTRLPDHSQWVQLTQFPDSVSQPALST